MLRKAVLLGVCVLAFSRVTAAADASPFGEARGCFLLWNETTGKFEKVIGEERCHERFVACSTFKVPLAVMAFDAGVLKDENVVLKWDGKKDSRPEVNQDHNAKTWIRDSVVWFSQRLTPLIGKERLQKYLHDFNYGNADLAAGITEAWLVLPSAKGPALKISAYEQVDFMKKLWSDQLPASKRAMQITREITYLETSPKGFRLSGKTGSNYYEANQKMKLGWFIGHLEKPASTDGSVAKQNYIVVTNFSDVRPVTPIEGEPAFGGPRAKKMTKALLSEQGLW